MNNEIFSNDTVVFIIIAFPCTKYGYIKEAFTLLRKCMKPPFTANDTMLFSIIYQDCTVLHANTRMYQHCISETFLTCIYGYIDAHYDYN